jgi:hypothetical protein
MIDACSLENLTAAGRRSLSAHRWASADGRLRGLTGSFSGSGTEKLIARAAGFNTATIMSVGLGDVIAARALGPTMRGECAAIRAWFGTACMVGQRGLSAASCFYIVRDLLRARDYVATSRTMMLGTGMATLNAGVLLARGNPEVADGYRIAFRTSVVTDVGISYTYSLQPCHFSAGM